MSMPNNMNWRALDRFSFGDSPTLGDELAELVLAGRKRATCWAVSDGPITSVGKRMVMLDGAGIPRAVLETVELVQRRFSEIDEAFAFDEGEGDRTLTYGGRRTSAISRGTAPSLPTWCSFASGSG